MQELRCCGELFGGGAPFDGKGRGKEGKTEFRHHHAVGEPGGVGEIPGVAGIEIRENGGAEGIDFLRLL